MIYIYKLTDPRNNEVRYIGKTTNIKRRYKQHLYDKRKSHKSSWVQSLRNQKLKPIMEILEICGDNWKGREIYWISQFNNLTNLKEGGGSDYMRTTSDETRQKLSIAHLGKKHTAKWNKNIGMSARNRHEIIINGITYCSLKEVTRKLKMDIRTVKKYYLKT